MTFQKLPSSMPQTPSSNGHDNRRELVAKRVRLMFGCFRRGEAEDVKTYTAAVANVLLDYSEDIIVSVTEPATGLPVKFDWLPTLKQVRDECERLKDLRAPVTRAAALLEKPVASEAEREAVAARMRALREELAAKSEVAKRIEASPVERALREGDEAKAKELAQQTMAGVRLSDEALRKFSGLAA